MNVGFMYVIDLRSHPFDLCLKHALIYPYLMSVQIHSISQNEQIKILSYVLINSNANAKWTITTNSIISEFKNKIKRKFCYRWQVTIHDTSINEN